MSYILSPQDHLAPHTSRQSFANLISLPYELVQSILASITNFEPWAYSSTPEPLSASITDEELMYTRNSMPLNLTNINQLLLGLSSTDDWLISTLSQHSYRLSRKGSGISAAVTQALRRGNARLERLHWAGKGSNTAPQICEESKAAGFSAVGRSPEQMSTATSMAQYHAHVELEKDAHLDEVYAQTRALRNTKAISSPATALVVYSPAPVLKLTASDLSEFVCRTQSTEYKKQMMALLVAIFITLAQCRSLQLENLERLERDTPIPSIETYESKDFATPKMSPRPDRPRSLSGSTIADVFAHEEALSFSAISMVYNSEAPTKRVQWEGSEEEASPKRPKLREYKQVSSGRVATLMDRFEKFHI